MSSADATEPKVEETKVAVPAAAGAAEEKPTSSAVFSMFGGGAKKEKKDEEERGDVSGSAKAQRDLAEAAKGDEVHIFLNSHKIASILSLMWW